MERRPTTYLGESVLSVLAGVHDSVGQDGQQHGLRRVNIGGGQGTLTTVTHHVVDSVIGAGVHDDVVEPLHGGRQTSGTSDVDVGAARGQDTALLIDHHDSLGMGTSTIAYVVGTDGHQRDLVLLDLLPGDLTDSLALLQLDLALGSAHIGTEVVLVL